MSNWIPLATYIDFEKRPYRTLMLIFAFRFIQAVVFGEKNYHPDQSWQGGEMAYHLAYRDEVPLVRTWEWINVYALRSVIWPFILSLPLHALRFLGLDTNFMVANSIIFMNSLVQVLGDYFLYYLAKHFLGVEGATMSLTYSLVNRRLNEIFQKTLTNGAEAVFSTCGLYYFTQLNPAFDKNMALMTMHVTLAFLVRSSSLVGWLPLALHFAFRSPSHFFSVVLAGLFVAIPIFGLSIGADSIYYGKLTIPQVNFVFVNVVENISKSFGVNPWFYYLDELPTFISENLMFFWPIITGMCLFTAYTAHGLIPSEGKNKSTFQSLLVFVVANLLILSKVEHKEQRFMTQIFPIFAIYWSFLW